MDIKTFGAYLRSLRESKGLGVNQLAQYVGISGAEISRLERGERQKINPNLLRKLAPKLGVSYEFLMQKIGYLPEILAESGACYDSTKCSDLAAKVCRLSPEEQAEIEKTIDSLLAKYQFIDVQDGGDQDLEQT